MTVRWSNEVVGERAVARRTPRRARSAGRTARSRAREHLRALVDARHLGTRAEGARRRRVRFPSRRRGRARRLAAAGRRGSAASAGPVRTRVPRRRGRTTGRAARRAPWRRPSARRLLWRREPRGRARARCGARCGCCGGGGARVSGVLATEAGPGRSRLSVLDRRRRRHARLGRQFAPTARS